MSIDTTKTMSYSWMSQASYLDLTGLLAVDTKGLVAHLKSSPINDGKIFSEQQAKVFTNSSTGYRLGKKVTSIYLISTALR